jgi:hypothetical protein
MHKKKPQPKRGAAAGAKVSGSIDGSVEPELTCDLRNANTKPVV